MEGRRMRLRRLLPLAAIAITVGASVELFTFYTLWGFSFAFLPAFLALQIIVEVFELTWTPSYLLLYIHGIAFYVVVGWLADRLISRSNTRAFIASCFILALAVLMGLAFINFFARGVAYLYEDPWQLTIPSIVWGLLGAGLLLLCGRRWKLVKDVSRESGGQSTAEARGDGKK
jgi:hypothetical protein